MDAVELAVVGEILQVAPDRFVRHLELLRQINGADGAALLQQSEDLMLTFGG